jgi:hypothetical protein
MASVRAGITTSIDGYITGPYDGPGKGLGEGGERLHYWVFCGPWTYAEERRGARTPPGFSQSLELEHLGVRQSPRDLYPVPRATTVTTELASPRRLRRYSCRNS